MNKRLLSIILAVCMIVTMLPVTTMAEETHTTIGTSEEIIAFELLAETEKTVTSGTSIKDLQLPEIMTVTVRKALIAVDEPVNGSGSSHEESEVNVLTIETSEVEVSEQQQTVEVIEPEWEETIQEISVTWTSQPEYELGTEGEYVFTPVIEGYTVSAELPEITVMVEASALMPMLISPMVAPTEVYNIWVGSTQVTIENKDAINGEGITGTVYYDSTTNTLTLNGASITSSYTEITGHSVGSKYGIYSNGDLNLELLGSNSIETEIPTVEGKHSVGIRLISGNLTISGDGSLTVIGGDVTSSLHGYSYGMYIGGDLVVDSVSLNAIGMGAGTYGASYGITVGSITITGSSIVNATGSNANNSCGINSTNISINGGEVTVIGQEKAMIAAPTLGSSPVRVTASANYDGSSPETYNQEKIIEYKYLKFEPATSSEVAQIDSTGYDTLQDAFNDVDNDQTIELLDNITLDATVTIASDNNKNFTLNLNGKTLDSGSNIAIKHSGTGTLTIKDTVTDGKITSKADINSNGTIDLRGGILAVESGTIENTLNNEDANAILKDHGENGAIIVTGGTIISTEGTAIYYGYPPYSSDPTIPSGILVPRGTPIIKGGLKAMNKAPDLSSYTNVKVTASTNYDGSESVTYNSDNYYDYKYKYLKFEPGSTPTFLTGSATISNTSPRIGDVLKGSIVDGNNTGTLTYIWKADETQVGTGTSYTVTIMNLGKKITLEISSSIETGTITSTPTAAVSKKVAPVAPDAPTLVSKTHNTITLTANTSHEFSKEGITWQTSNVFSDLTSSTTYTFYQRIAETNETEASASSAGFNVTTNSNDSGGSSGGGSDSGSGGSSLGSGSSSDNSSSNVIVISPTLDNPNSPTQGEIKVTGIVDSKGNSIVNITDKTVIDAFDKALEDAKKKGNERNGITVVLRVDTGSKAGSNVTVNLPKTVQDTIIANKIANTIVVVDNPGIRIGMDLDAVQEINKQAKSEVNITATRKDNDKLTGDGKKAIGSRPVFDLNVNYGSGKQVQRFGTGNVSVNIPYTLGTNEKAGNVQAVYVDGNGKVHWLVNSVYDSVEKVLRFSTNHFSTYGVGYKEDAPTFTDIARHWAKEDIEFVISNGLFSGTSAITFSPNTAMTRGMFVTVVGRLADADVSNYNKSSFSDVNTDAYYMGYIEWASKNSIVKGTGNGNFTPDESITREQMAAIIRNYAKIMDIKLPQAHGENIFGDSAKISAYAKEAVKEMQIAGILSGKNANLFDPQGTVTRAEIAAVLRRFAELGRSSDTM